MDDAWRDAWNDADRDAVMVIERPADEYSGTEPDDVERPGCGLIELRYVDDSNEDDTDGSHVDQRLARD